MREEHSALIPALVRTLRKEAGLTQSKLAALLGLDSSTVSRYEKGDLLPSETVVRLLVLHMANTGRRDNQSVAGLADAYGIELDELLGGRAVAAAPAREGAWVDGTTASEREILRDFWLARRLGDPALVEEIDAHIRSIKRISKKRRVWSDEIGEESA